MGRGRKERGKGEREGKRRKEGRRGRDQRLGGIKKGRGRGRKERLPFHNIPRSIRLGTGLFLISVRPKSMQQISI